MSAGFMARALRHKSFAIGGALVAALLFTAALSYVWTPHSATDLDIPNKLAAPTLAHWLGVTPLERLDGRALPLRP